MTLESLVEVYTYVPMRIWREVYQGTAQYHSYDPNTGKEIKIRGSRSLHPWEEHFIPPFVTGLPREAYLPVISAFLEPEPESWRRTAWNYVINRLTDSRNKRIALVGAKINPAQAKVVDAQYRPELCPEGQRDALYRKLWRTHVPLPAYLCLPTKKRDKYQLPEVAVGAIIPFTQLRVIKAEEMKV